MLSLDTRIELLNKLGQYMRSDDETWQEVQLRAKVANPWFTPEHIALAADNIAHHFLQKDVLREWLGNYKLPAQPKLVGIVCAGNIPLVGFHDLLCVFITGHKALLKLSSKDTVLMQHLLYKLAEWEPATEQYLQTGDVLKGCDAYITTGSNNTSRYFEQYFAKFPHIIRKNRTSVAVLEGDETDEELNRLADDVFLYYGLGCRNVTQLQVPEGYNFERLLLAFKKYEDYIHHHKYKNNYDYHLALYLLNKVPYMTNESVLLVENELPFSAVSVVHYQYYSQLAPTLERLSLSNDIQAVISRKTIPFGEAQRPSVNTYADNVDTMAFLCGL